MAQSRGTERLGGETEGEEKSKCTGIERTPGKDQRKTTREACHLECAKALFRALALHPTPVLTRFDEVHQRYLSSKSPQSSKSSGSGRSEVREGTLPSRPSGVPLSFSPPCLLTLRARHALLRVPACCRGSTSFARSRNEIDLIKLRLDVSGQVWTKKAGCAAQGARHPHIMAQLLDRS